LTHAGQGGDLPAQLAAGEDAIGQRADDITAIFLDGFAART
jgi:hypothetical protein